MGPLLLFSKADTGRYIANLITNTKMANLRSFVREKCLKSVSLASQGGAFPYRPRIGRNFTRETLTK